MLRSLIRYVNTIRLAATPQRRINAVARGFAHRPIQVTAKVAAAWSTECHSNMFHQQPGHRCGRMAPIALRLTHCRVHLDIAWTFRIRFGP